MTKVTTKTMTIEVPGAVLEALRRRHRGASEIFEIGDLICHVCYLARRRTPFEFQLDVYDGPTVERVRFDA